jgi:hypothetical protein
MLAKGPLAAASAGSGALAAVHAGAAPVSSTGRAKAAIAIAAGLLRPMLDAPAPLSPGRGAPIRRVTYGNTV